MQRFLASETRKVTNKVTMVRQIFINKYLTKILNNFWSKFISNDDGLSKGNQMQCESNSGNGNGSDIK